jgi:hypothetical protein
MDDPVRFSARGEVFQREHASAIFLDIFIFGTDLMMSITGARNGHKSAVFLDVLPAMC